jgi:hypothetical protein
MIMKAILSLACIMSFVYALIAFATHDLGYALGLLGGGFAWGILAIIRD